jgi:hypothetical protein
VPSIDPHLVLAFTMAASPGAYAVLLGAGVSIGAGVPTAWGVQQDLIGRIARAAGESPADLEAWYSSTFGRAPTYDNLLEELAPTPFERQAILRAFFEPPDEDPPAPSPAHVALARLVASGHIRVVLTTNFDRLLETALNAEGVAPIVIASPTEIAGLPPLHLIRCLVVHLHGDYLTPTAMLNTPGELRTYGTEISTLLDRILDDHGLMIIGWSGVWDVALRDAMTRRINRRFTTYWVGPGDLADKALDLANHLAAVHCRATADEFLGQLEDATHSVRATTTDPRSLPVAIAVAKRELAGRNTAIPLHDRLRREHDTSLQAAISLADPSQHPRPKVKELEDACALYLALIATTAYWGDATTDDWWLSDLPRLAQQAHAGGSTAVLNMRQFPALYALYTSGTAAVAAGRWDLLGRLLDERVTYRDRYSGKDRPIFTLSPGALYGMKRASARIHGMISLTFTDHLSLGAHAYEDAWERFEYLRLLATTDWGYRIGGGWGSDVPHVRADGSSDNPVPLPSAWIRSNITSDSHPLLVAGAFASSYNNFSEAIGRYDESFSSMARQAAWSTLPAGGGMLPSVPFHPDETPMWR